MEYWCQQNPDHEGDDDHDGVGGDGDGDGDGEKGISSEILGFFVIKIQAAHYY